jgi:subtilase family serine protease
MIRIVNVAAAAIGAALLAVTIFTPAGAQQRVQLHQMTLVAAVPDLVIENVKDVPADNSQLKVRVRNVGSGNAGPNNMKIFYHRSGHVVVRGAVVPALAKGHATWVAIDADSPVANAQHVTLRVDDPNRVAELNEGNNGYTYK